MSALIEMFIDYVPYAIVAVAVSFIAYLIEERYKIRAFFLVPIGLVAALAYRLFSYYPSIGIIAYIAACYATSSLAMPMSDSSIRISYSISSATMFALVLYFLISLA